MRAVIRLKRAPNRPFLQDVLKLRSVRFWGINLAIWTVVGVALAAQLQLEYVVRDIDLSTRDVLNIYYGQFTRAGWWALFTPLVFFLHERLPLRGSRRWAHLTVHFSLAVVLMVFIYLFRATVFYGPMHETWEQFFLRNLINFPGRNLFDLPLYGVILLVAHLRSIAAREHDTALREAELRAQVVEAELRAIKYQLKPHFVFNALNAVAALIREERHGKAIDTLSELSLLLRTLSDAPSRDRITLDEEVQFISRLLAVEKVRFGEKLQVSLEIAEDCRAALVPSLLLQPLVENAIKHGISKRVRPGRIVVRAVRSATQLTLEVVNDGPPPLRHDDSTLVSGVGLNATQARLARLYGADFSLKCDLDREEGASVRVVIPLQFAEKPPAPSSAPNEISVFP